MESDNQICWPFLDRRCSGTQNKMEVETLGNSWKLEKLKIALRYKKRVESNLLSKSGTNWRKMSIRVERIKWRGMQSWSFSCWNIQPASKREREREREKETDRHRDRDRERERQTDREINYVETAPGWHYRRIQGERNSTLHLRQQCIRINWFDSDITQD